MHVGLRYHRPLDDGLCERRGRLAALQRRELLPQQRVSSFLHARLQLRRHHRRRQATRLGTLFLVGRGALLVRGLQLCCHHPLRIHGLRAARLCRLELVRNALTHRLAALLLLHRRLTRGLHAYRHRCALQLQLLRNRKDRLDRAALLVERLDLGQLGNLRLLRLRLERGKLLGQPRLRPHLHLLALRKCQ